MWNEQTLDRLERQFRTNTQVLAAIGDETRQAIVVTLIQYGCEGARVGDIQARTHLSRPAVSHHLKLLKAAGIVSVHKETTKNFYYIDPTSWIMNLKALVLDIEALLPGSKQPAAGGNVL